MHKHVDAEVLQSLRDLDEDGSQAFLFDLIDTFLEDTKTRLAAIEASLGDAKTLASAVHGLKSGCGNMGAFAMASLCVEMERRAAAGDISAAVALWEPLQTEYRGVERELRSIRFP